MPPKKRGDGPIGQALLFVAISALLLTILFPSVNTTVGKNLDRILNPLIGFGGREPALTILLASALMVLITTVLRHFFMDWAHMARVQDVMRVYQGELKTATKENNKFKIKQLTDMQPEIMKMQGEMSSSQLKPMLLTMVVIIPTFSWLFAFVTAPVPHDVALSPDSDPVVLMAVDKDLLHFEAVGSGNATTIQPWQHTALTIVPVEFDFVKAKGGGTADVSKGEARVGVLDAKATNPFNPVGIAPVQLPPDEYEVTISQNGFRVNHASSLERVEGRFANHFGLVLFGNETTPTRAMKLNPGPAAKVTFLENDTGYLVIPLTEGEALEGTAQVTFASAGRTQTVNLTGASAYSLSQGAPPLTLQPHSMSLPWVGDWDLLGAWWILPHWILYYSLTSIGFGTLVQKGLRLAEHAVVKRRGTEGG
ncbi:MAG: DUF106 domain-containing protein [Euryarchaeota archaeon]|nr:DUF106 domain-containing protein [Euryarchaeota archaeon]